MRPAMARREQPKGKGGGFVGRFFEDFCCLYSVLWFCWSFFRGMFVVCIVFCSFVGRFFGGFFVVCYKVVFCLSMFECLLCSWCFLGVFAGSD